MMLYANFILVHEKNQDSGLSALCIFQAQKLQYVCQAQNYTKNMRIKIKNQQDSGGHEHSCQTGLQCALTYLLWLSGWVSSNPHQQEMPEKVHLLVSQEKKADLQNASFKWKSLLSAENH